MKNQYQIITIFSVVLVLLILQGCNSTSTPNPAEVPTFQLYVKKILAHKLSRTAITIEPKDTNKALTIQVQIGNDSYKDTVISSKSIVEFLSPENNSICTVTATNTNGEKYSQKIPIEIIANTLPEMVLIGDTLWVATSEVTQKMWNNVMSENFSVVIGDEYPVESVSWYDAVEYCNKLSISQGLTPYYKWVSDTLEYSTISKGYRLPFETEWKFVTLNGKQTDLFNGNLTFEGCSPIDQKLDRIAWYCGNTSFPNKVKRKAPNDFGLFDVHGNVWEWCNDWVFPNGETKLLKGGSWYNDAHFAMQTHFYNLYPTDRFRIYSFRVYRTN